MRRTGVLDPAERFGLCDHACWAYGSAAERAAAASSWIADGLALGQRAMYVAAAPVDDLTEDLDDVPERDEAIACGALVIADARNLYDLSTPIDARAQLAVYAAAVEQAIKDGFAGIRVAADITALVADPARRPAHLHWEQFADRYMTEQPLAPLCLYDRRQIEFPAVELIHPLAGPTPRPYSLYALGAHESALAGEIDGLTAEPLADAVTALPDDGDTIEISGLRFLDGYGAWLLQDALHGRRVAGRPLALRGASPLVRRVWAACSFDPSLLVG
jgi:anti-anti-sigma regulatory factor